MKVNRGMPVMVSSPIVPRMIPTPAVIRALAMDFWARYVSTTKPRIIREKYSGGPKRKATETRGGARSIRPMTPKVPAIKDPKAAMPRAGPARPCRAI